MAGKGAKKRSHVRKAQVRKAAQKAAKQQEKFIASLPKVTEDNLLSFQLAHFGDDSCPVNWFVDPNTASTYQPEYEEEDDSLGYYHDGVKRTLTDEQIAMFRRTELWQLKREQAQQKEEEEEESERADLEATKADAPSPVSQASSLEDELLAFATVSRKAASPPPAETTTRQFQPSRSDTSDPAASWKRRRSQNNVPYEQRHKRQWESYIEDVDPIEGSLTQRRMLRELDDQQHESVEMDY